jgi:hypothetical protein
MKLFIFPQGVFQWQTESKCGDNGFVVVLKTSGEKEKNPPRRKSWGKNGVKFDVDNGSVQLAKKTLASLNAENVEKAWKKEKEERSETCIRLLCMYIHMY